MRRNFGKKLLGEYLEERRVLSAAVGDASVLEGNSGTQLMVFPITLSAPAASNTKINWHTTGGTANWQNDYLGNLGSVTIPQGKTQALVTIGVKGDMVVEQDEQFYLDISAARGILITDSRGAGTIKNDDGVVVDPPPVDNPIISVGNATAVEGGNTTTGSSSTALHTSGNKILDSQNRVIDLNAIAIYGAETPSGMPSNINQKMDQAKSQGFNTIRLPYSSQFLTSSANMTKLDNAINYAGQIGMRVILDHHRSNNGESAQESGLWYDGSYTEQGWVNDWSMLAARYKNSPAVIGADLHNEPHGQASWSSWKTAAQKAGNAVLAQAPNWLIIVEGVGSVQDSWWGGDLTQAGNNPIVLNIANRLVYSPHDYGPDEFAIGPFNSSAFPNNMPAYWDKMWGYLEKQNIAPIWVGEFGTLNTSGKSGQWLNALVSYMDTNDVDWSWWPLDNNTQISSSTKNLLSPVPLPALSGGSSGTTPAGQLAFAITLSAPSTQQVVVHYATANGTATGGDYVATSGDVTFAAGQTSKTVNVLAIGDTTNETNETFTLVLTNPVNGQLGNAIGNGTITNDD